jgi:hypothetical protein
MDFFQVIIAVAIFVVVSFFVMLSIQLFFILKELRVTVARVNEILKDAEDVSDEVKKSLETVGNGMRQITTVLDIFSMIKNKFSK